jgi:hypothetical protein
MLKRAVSVKSPEIAEAGSNDAVCSAGNAISKVPPCFGVRVLLELELELETDEVELEVLVVAEDDVVELVVVVVFCERAAYAPAAATKITTITITAIMVRPIPLLCRRIIKATSLWACDHFGI